MKKHKKRRLRTPSDIVGLAVGLAAMLAATAHAADADDESLFADMLRGDVMTADLAARVEVIAVAPVKVTGALTRYWIEATPLEIFAGTAPERLVFYLWSEEPQGDDLTGERLIVTLSRNPQDRQYYVPDNGHAFPDDADLHPIARAAALARQHRAVDVTPVACRPGSYDQPGGDFAVRVYCDDALGTNIAVDLVRLGAPFAGGYSLTRRTWHGGDWASGATSFLWAASGEALYVATSPVYGTGSLYRLSLRDQTAVLLWRRSDTDCMPIITGASDDSLNLRVRSCDGAGERAVRVPLN